MYYFYLDKMLFPVAPEKLQINISGNNKTYNLINEGEINVLKNAKLTDISFEVLLPNQKYAFAKYKSGFKNADYYLQIIKGYVQEKKTAQFIVSRQLPNGKVLFDTNMTVSIEDYSIKEDAKSTGFDMICSIKLKRYVPYGTKTYKVKQTKVIEDQKTPLAASANAAGKGKESEYTVAKGDSLWKIAKQVYGDGSQWKKIADANKGTVKNPNLIYPNQKLIIP